VTDVPVATTIHGPLGGELADLYGRVALGGVAVVAISHSQRAAAPEVPVARVIHHGIDAADFPLGKGDGGYVLFLGRLAPDKGADRAIRAARAAGVPIVLAGKMREAREQDYFEAEVGPLLGADAEYVGEVPHEHKVELLGNAQAVLFPIRWPEPFGLVMLEAFACGTPVLAFPEGAVPEVVEHGHNGFLCDDEDDLTRAIGLLDTIDRLDCRATVEGYFSAHRMVQEHVQLFESLLTK
jgi:glycosyltransferase involved in cell wall biosynthesis